MKPRQTDFANPGNLHQPFIKTGRLIHQELVLS